MERVRQKRVKATAVSIEVIPGSGCAPAGLCAETRVSTETKIWSLIMERRQVGEG